MPVWALLVKIPRKRDHTCHIGFVNSDVWNWLSLFCMCLSSGVFEIAEASGVRTGTKIIIHLKSDCKEFASEARVRGAWSLGFWRRVTGSTESARHLMLCVLGDLVWVGVFGGRRQSWGVLGVFLGLAAQAH